VQRPLEGFVRFAEVVEAGRSRHGDAIVADQGELVAQLDRCAFGIGQVLGEAYGPVHVGRERI